jgi:hypothetical protein
MNETSETTLRHVMRDGIARSATVVGLAGIGLIHLLDAPGKFSETPYMGYLYLALIAGALVTAFALIRGSHPLAWTAAIALSASAVVGYTLTRTVGLPQAHGDIGNWTEPLGLASLFVEGTVIGVAVHALAEKAARARGTAVRRTPAARRAGVTA